jgi:D-alanine-D-alanine ligase-like ATP-grasp enzyme
LRAVIAFEDPPPVVPRHYAFVTRMVIELFQRGDLPDVASIEVEPEWGYVTRIAYRGGETRMTYGNDIGLNSGAASDVASDKAFTKHFLQRSGFETPAGSAFLLPWWAELIGGPRADVAMRTTADAERYVRETLGLPVYVKPVAGSQGKGVCRCERLQDVPTAIAELDAHRAKVALVEEAVDLPDYRLVMLHGEMISAYRRVPLTVVGDGVATVLALMTAVDAEYRLAGRDTRIAFDDARIVRSLDRRGLRLDSIPAASQRLALRDISNLSAGGTAEDVTDQVAPRWRTMGRDLAASFGLQFCGVDLACGDIADPGADYSILELNAAPGLDHYASVGAHQERVVRELYAKVLNVPPRHPARERAAASWPREEVRGGG